jgi:hypothetical protein
VTRSSVVRPRGAWRHVVSAAAVLLAVTRAAPADARVTMVALADQILRTEASLAVSRRSPPVQRLLVTAVSRGSRELGSNGGRRRSSTSVTPRGALLIDLLAVDAAGNVYSAAGTRPPQIIRVTTAGQVTIARS